MNRRDIVIVAALVALLLAWPMIDREIARRFYPERFAPPAEQTEDPAAPPVAAELTARADRESSTAINN